MSSRGKILVIRGGAIGDFVLTLPVFTALRKQFPTVHLEVLGYSHIADLALAGGVVDQVRSIEARPLAEFFARGGGLSSELAEYFSSFAIVISYLYDPDEIFQKNVARCSKAQFIVGPHRPNEQELVHATEVFLRPLERLAIFEADAVPQLEIGAAMEKSKWIAVHCGSGSEKKNWPVEKWAGLIEWILRHTEYNLLLVGGEADLARVRKLAANLPVNRFRLVESLPLVELAARLKTCAGFIGHDSGISHLAAALGLPGLVLWGETISEIWRPLSSRVQIVRSDDGLAGISVPQVAAALANFFD